MFHGHAGRTAVLLAVLIQCATPFSSSPFYSTFHSEHSGFSLSAATVAASKESVTPFNKNVTTTIPDNYFSRSKTKKRIKELFQKAKRLERQGRWQQAIHIFNTILNELDPHDSHSFLALAKLQARRGGDARSVFRRGTTACPTSIHLWQAWAVYEQPTDIAQARKLFQTALTLDGHNPYVCHAYGLLERKAGNGPRAQELWERGLQRSCSAALVCSLGELLIAEEKYTQARELYESRVESLKTEREQIEVYLALAWLEEKYFSDLDRAAELIEASLMISPKSSVALVAKARLEGRRSHKSTDDATRLTLARACLRIESNSKKDPHEDGRVYNAWARLEVKANRLDKAREILRKGVERYPRDHLLLQAAGKVEERLGNYLGAKKLYGASLTIEPCAATLVSFALLGLNHPDTPIDFSVTKALFEEALMIDHRHGPAYNAYARAVYQHQKDKTETRRIYDEGLKANCTDSASIYHGYAQFELSLGNVERAYDLLVEGVQEVGRANMGTDLPNRSRALFLIHTLGMLELNRDQPKTSLKTFTDGMKLLGDESSQLLLGAALSQLKLGKEEDARTLFEKAVLIDESHAQAWHSWAAMEMKAGNTETARQLFECGIKRTPHYGPLWQAYGVLASRDIDKDRARGLFARGIEKAPKHVPLYQSWASLELQQENYDAAKALIGKSLTLNKRNGAGWIIAAEVERRMGKRGLANLLLCRGIEVCPSNPRLYKALGDSLVLLGKYDEAREVLERGIEKDSHFPQLYHSLAELEARIGNLDALAALHKRTANIFSTTSLQQDGSGMTSARPKRSYVVPRSVSVLAQRIVESDADDDEEEYDNSYMLERIMNPSASIDDDLTDALLHGNNTSS